MTTGNKRDVELAISVRSDMQAAHADLRRIQGEIDGVARATQEWGKASERAAAQQASTAAEQEARLRAMVDASIEKREADLAAAAAAREAATAARQTVQATEEEVAARQASVEAFNRSFQAIKDQTAALEELDAALSRDAASMEEIAANEARLDQLMRDGAISAEDYEKALESLGKQEDRLAKTQARQAKELDAVVKKYDPASAALRRLEQDERKLEEARRRGTISQQRYNQAMAGLKVQRAQWQVQASGITATAGALDRLSLSSATAQRQFGVILANAAQGNWGMAQQSLLTLGNEVGVVRLLFSGTAIAAGTLVAAVGAVAAANEAAARDQARFNAALILTNNYAGQTSASMDALARSTSDARGLGQARQVLIGLAASGRVGADSFESVGRAAVAMAELTGRSADQVVGEFSRMTDDVAKWATEADRQYHFLNTGTLAQIRNLQEQGRATEAAKIASDAFFDAATQRSEQLTNNLTTLERTWKSLGGTVKGLWQDLKDFAGSTAASWSAMSAPVASLSTADLEALLRQQEALQRFAAPEDQRRQRQERIAAMQAELDARKALAEQQGEERAAEQRANDALESISKRREELLTREERKQKALNKLAADYVALWNEGRNAELPQLQGMSFAGGQPSGGQFDRDRERIEEQFKEPDTRKQESAFAGLNRQITERIAALNAAAESQEKLSDAQRFAVRLQASMADGTVKLTAAEREQLQLRLQALATADAANQAQQDARTLADIQLQYLKAIGDGAGAAGIEIERQYGELLRRLEARSDAAGVELIQKLINVGQAQAQVEEIQREIERITSAQSRAEQSVQARQQSGLISEITARQQLVDLHRQTATELEALRPQLEALTSAPGEIGERASQALAQLNSQAEQLRTTSGLLAETLRSGFEQGLAGALQGLARGTEDLRSAMTSLVDSVANAMIQLAAQNLAQKAASGLAGLFNQGADVAADQAGAAAQAAAITTAGTTAATAMGTGISAAAGTGATAMATAITAAGSTAATAMASAIAAASAASSTSSAISGIAGAASVAAATGGHIRGPGTGTSDSIPAMLSDYEFVTRSAVVKQPGALQFLRAFNRDGMGALRRFRFAAGGLATLRESHSAEPLPVGGGPGNTTVESAVNLHVYDDPQRIAERAFMSREGQDAFMVMLSRDPAKVRAVLKI